MGDGSNREKEIFEHALDLTSAEERQRYLESACGDDTVLLARVEALLRADAAGEEFLPEQPKETARIISEKAGDKIGRYKLLQQIGEGGCGVVYMAEQSEPVRRRVALKIIKLGMDTKNVIARFEAERQALALMDHPNIAKIFDAGATETGRPYFVMELVRGVRITDYCDENSLSTEERLKLFTQVCQAIQHAHQKGVIHRDIKPSNILVTVNDALPVPKIIDFGIAKATNQQPLTDKTLFTAFEQFIGTPAYMSPEQAVMTSLDIDTRTDIYSLGVLLYELLTSKTPFDANELLKAGLDEIRRTIREQEPPKPSTRLSTLDGASLTTTARHRHTEPPKLINLIRGDLDWIVMKCLEKDRTRRYETANGLAMDIERHLKCEPVLARPPSHLYEFQKTVRRHKFGFAAATALIMVLALGAFVSTWEAVRATRAEGEQIGLRQQADEARVRAEGAERETKQQLYNALLEQARATVKSGELGQRVRALDALRRAAAISNAVELRREVVAALALPDLRFERELLAGSDFTLILLDPSFERMALCRGRGPVEIRSVSDHRLLISLPASTNLMAYLGKWSANGHFLAIKRDYDPVGRRADVEIWEVATAQRILLFRDVPWGRVAFHPHLPQVIVISHDGSAAVWNLEDGNLMTRFTLPAVPFDLQYSPDGKRFALRYVRDDPRPTTIPIGVVSVHDSAEGAVLVSQAIPPGLHWLDWHPSGRWIGVGGEDGSVNLIDSQTGESRTLGRHRAQANTIAFSPDGRYLITGGWERELICWDLQAMRRAFTIALGSYQLAFRADGRQCVVVTRPDLRVQLHAFERPTTHREFAEELGGGIQHGAFSRDGRWLAASGEKCAGVWDLAGGGPAALNDAAYGAHFFFTPDTQELFGSRSRGNASDCFRWRLTSAVPQSGTGGSPRLDALPLRRREDFTSLCLSSNAVVMTCSKGSQILAPEEMETGSDRWVPTSPGLNGVSPEGRWLAIYGSFHRHFIFTACPDWNTLPN
ncbi:MAG TPA: serine/threonine-protein kinase [Haliangiales bacterium]|nr:serine/threonine-protein kinase [Haliangiales bacterium]